MSTNKVRNESVKKNQKEEVKPTGSKPGVFLLDRFSDQTPRRLHQLGTKPKHQHAELHLVQRPVAVEIPFLDHRPHVFVRQISEPQHRRRVTPEALERDDASLSVHQQLEPVAELSDQTLAS